VFDFLHIYPVRCPIIFTTAYDNYAIEAFKSKGLHYLQKPINKEDFTEAIKRWQETRLSDSMQHGDNTYDTDISGGQRVYQTRILQKVGVNLRTILIADVLYFYVEEQAVFAFTKEGQAHLIDYQLDKLEEILDPKYFFRINRQFIISISAIDKMSTYTKGRVKIVLKSFKHQEVVTSAERSPEFRNWLLTA
jgi:DNA-binding LytR/AlgR family response regulator